MHTFFSHPSTSTCRQALRIYSSPLLLGREVLLLPGPGESAMAGLGWKRVYLSAYNWAMFFGWLQVFFLAAKALLETGHEDVYNAIERPLQIVYTAAIMEILHGLVGLVRSPVSATLPQLGSRLYVNWGVMWCFPQVRTSFFVTSLVLVSSLTEIIRYSFFGMKEAIGSTPSWLLWLRYSSFLIMYPPGITSEIGLIYKALPFMKASGGYNIFPASNWKFSSYYVAITVLVFFIPCSPYMYLYMLGQRTKALSKAKTA